MTRLLPVLLVALALLGAFIGRDRLSAATPTVVIVNPANMNGWGFFEEVPNATGEMVAGAATPPRGVGSAHMTLDVTGRELLGTQAYAGTLLSDISTLTYSTYQDPSSPSSTAISLQLDIDYDLTDSDTSWQGRLVFEPYYTNTVNQSVWEPWDALTGKWWGSGGVGATGCPMSAPCTWSQVLTLYPNAGIRDSVGVLQFKAGGPWAGFDGNVDGFTIDVGSTATYYDFEPECSTDCYVRPDGDDGNSGNADNPAEAKQTIQAAVDAASSGGTVHVAAGTYVEQVAIDKPLTLTGAGMASTVIQSPATLATQFTTSASNKPIVYVHDTTGVQIDHLKVDGAGLGNGNARMEGVTFYNAGGAVDSVSITGVRETPLSGSQHGVALYAYNADATARTLTVTNSVIDDYQKNGMALNGAGLTATVDGNTITGAGSTDKIAQNGIQIGFGATGSITNNTISGNACIVIADCVVDPTSSATADGASGVLLYTPGAGTIAVTDNVLSGNQFAVWTVAADDIDVSGNTISGPGSAAVSVYDCDQWCGASSAVGTTGSIDDNSINGQTYGLLARDYVAGAPAPALTAHGNNITGSGTAGAWTDASIDATDNWWDSANGPTHASNTFNVGSQGAVVTDGVAFVPWLDAAAPSGTGFAPVTTSSSTGGFSSIQAAVDAASAGATVTAAAGTFTENVTVSQSVAIAGAGETSTNVIPALSGPTCAGGSICAGGSNVFLVQANDVTISNLTVDGDNPTLTSGVVQMGADLDARNGIITDYNAGVFNNLTVHDTTVKNIYLRGVYAASGGTFNFHDNYVENVQGEAQSIALFNFGGSGVFENNLVFYANDAIASNWSKGTQYLNNSVKYSGSGIHTDNNGGSGGTADLIEGNFVWNCNPNGYGIWTFAAYVSPTVTHNSVRECAVGLTAAGQQAAVTTSFIENDVDGNGLAGSTGVYVTTSLFGWGSANASASFEGNIIKNNDDGFYLESEPGYTLSLSAERNAIFNNPNSAVSTANTGTFDVTMTANWWGDASGPATTLNPGAGGGVADGIAYSPWLGDGTDTSTDLGFQLASPMTWIVAEQVCDATCIQAAIDFASNGDTLVVGDGVFNEHVIVNKSITLTHSSSPIIDGGGNGDVVTISVDGTTLDGFEIRNGANGIVVTAANSVTVTNNNVHDFTSAGLRASNGTGADYSSNTVTGPHSGSCVGGFWGMLLENVSGIIDGNTISGIGNGLLSGCQEGRAIEAKGSGTLGITNNDISQYQKSGIIVRDAVNSIIDGNTTAGEGATAAIAMNGITAVSSGATSITNNQTSGHHYTPQSNVSCGILVIGTATITNNQSNADEVGICAVDGVGTEISSNTVTAHRQQGIYIDSTDPVLVDGNLIDGQGSGTTASAGTTPDDDTRYYGVFAVDSLGTISNNIIKGITHGSSNGTQSGVGVRVTARSGGVADINITGNDISDIQKNAMVITNYYGGIAVHADVTNNTVAGNGPINYIAQTGIQVSNGATATVTGNDVSGYDYTPFTWAAVGILLIDAGPSEVADNNIHDLMEGMYVQQTDKADIHDNSFSTFVDTAIFVYLSNSGTYSDNTINGGPGSFGVYFYDTSTNNTFTGNAFTGNDYGVFLDYSGGAPTGNTFHFNDFIGNSSYGLIQYGTFSGPVANAENNWWDACDGPSGDGPGTGDAVSANVDFDPWLHGACDFDGDGLSDDSEMLVHGTDWQNPDTDGDGCSDGRELLYPHTLGGERDPLNPWDFFDVPFAALRVDSAGIRDGGIGVTSDVIALLAYTGVNVGSPDYESDYDGNGVRDGLQYDRSLNVYPESWRSGPPDGGIGITTDVIALLAQVGDSCQ